jgi:hypothetical protein
MPMGPNTGRGGGVAIASGAGRRKCRYSVGFLKLGDIGAGLSDAGGLIQELAIESKELSRTSHYRLRPVGVPGGRNYFFVFLLAILRHADIMYVSDK